MLAGNTIGQGAICYIDWIMADGIVPLVLRFLIGLATLVCMGFLLAGLVLSISSKKDGSASFFAGLAGAKKYKKAIFLWSFVLALAGMLLSRIFLYPGGIFWPFSSYLLSLLIQFPFTLNLNPSTFAEIPGYGGRSLLFWTYPYGFGDALEFSAISLLLFILTAFVVPLIVVEQKTLREAVVGSFAIMKKTWIELTSLHRLSWNCRIRRVPYVPARPGSPWDGYTTRTSLRPSHRHVVCSWPLLLPRIVQRWFCGGNRWGNRSAGSLPLCKEQADARIS